MKVSVDLDVSIASGAPKVMLSSRHDIKNAKLFDLIDGKMTVEADFDLAEIDEIRVTFLDKEPSFDPNKDTFIEITNLVIDDINLQHFIYEGIQWPRYDRDFMLAYQPPDFYKPGCRMYLNGVWTIHVRLPIWKFLMESYHA